VEGKVVARALEVNVAAEGRVVEQGLEI